MSRNQIGSATDREVAIGRLAGAGPAGPRSAETALPPVDAAVEIAPKPLRAPTAMRAESLRVDPADLAPLAGMTGEALLAEMVRLDLLLARRGKGDGPDALSVEVGAAAIRETVRRLRLLQAAGDSLVAGEN